MTFRGTADSPTDSAVIGIIDSVDLMEDVRSNWVRLVLFSISTVIFFLKRKKKRATFAFAIVARWFI